MMKTSHFFPSSIWLRSELQLSDFSVSTGFLVNASKVKAETNLSAEGVITTWTCQVTGFIVAPVTIADDVMVAAGSTITKDVEQGALVLSRTPQKSIKNFFYKFFGTK